MTGPRSLLFKKPAWAAASKPTSTTENAPAFGEQRVYDEIIAEEKKKRAQREARRRERAEKATSEFKDGSAEPATKKRRISEDDVDDLDSSSESSSAKSTPKEAQTPEVVETKRVTRGTPTKQKQLLPGLDDEPLRKAKPAPSDVINLDDDEPKEGNAASAVETKKASMDPTEDDDPFIRELERKVREKARLRRLAKDGGDQPSPSGACSGRSPSVENVSSEFLQSASSLADTIDGSTPKVQNVQILVLSSIPGTKDILVKRHSSQTLQKIREYFCERFKLEPAFAQKVIFTWRGTKLYNSSTADSLIKILKQEAGIDPSSDEDPSNGKIQIEAVTQEILDERQQARAKAAAAAAAARKAEEEGYVEEPPPSEEPKEKVVINLVSPGIETLQLSVRPSTRVSKIMRAFRAHRAVDGTKTCWLVFDGERLDENATAERVGFEDGDNVEVHLR
jgi:hypothetical protein